MSTSISNSCDSFIVFLSVLFYDCSLLVNCNKESSITPSVKIYQTYYYGLHRIWTSAPGNSPFVGGPPQTSPLGPPTPQKGPSQAKRASEGQKGPLPLAPPWGVG